ncbi:MAG: energy transducer TonB [Gammaproteobacteria bacterium]|nr:energy transducer TonB [Gammaproteobacteria bacterium]
MTAEARAAASALEGDTPPERDRLATTVLIALLLHGVVILGITFGRPKAPQGVAPSLDVQLVVDALDQPREGEAAYLAQADRQGRGSTTERLPALTPRGLQPRPLQDPGPPDPRQADPTGRETADPVLAVRVPRITVLYSGPVSDTPATPGQRLARRATAPPTPLTESGGDDRADRARLTGPLARADEPLTPDTRAAVIAPWLDAWRRKVERFGTLNFPHALLRGREAAPVLEIEVLADGRLGGVKVQRSSGDPAIDEAALQILRRAAPFPPFPEALAAATPSVRFAYEWRFEAGGGGG